MTAIQWDGVPRDFFEPMVAALLGNLFPDSVHVDGSGGDGGRDVQRTGSDGLHVYQLKSFAGRVSPSRRRQIAGSLQRAKSLDPVDWTLIVPIDPTPEELEWFDKLRSQVGFPIDWWGKSWLDAEFAERQFIASYFLEGHADKVMALLKELNQEQAALANGVPDALDRARTLVTRANDLDPYYRFAISSDGAEAGVKVIPRYPGAEQARPITVSVVLSFPKTEAGNAAKAAFEESLDYGSPARIDSEFVQQVEIDAPAGLGGSHTGVVLEVGSGTIGERPEIELALVVLDDADRPVASLPVNLVRESAGAKGQILVGSDRAGLLRMRLVTDVPAQTLSGTFHASLSGRTFLPHELLPVVRLLGAFGPDRHIAFRTLAGEPIGIVSSPTGAPWVDETLIRILEQLGSLQAASGNYTPISLVFTDEDIAELGRGTRLLAGEAVETTWNSIRMTMVASDAGSMPEMGSPNSYRIHTDQPETVIVGGVAYRIGQGAEIQLDSAQMTDASIESMETAATGTSVEVELVPAASNGATVKLRTVKE